jgi:hypothetical protein
MGSWRLNQNISNKPLTGKNKTKMLYPDDMR